MARVETATESFLFGPFRLRVAGRELLAHGVPVPVGQRAFDILLLLVERQGALVTKDELMAEVWPGVVVEENNIQVHVSALRKVLRSAGDDERYVVTVAGRGYRFVAPVVREGPAVEVTSTPLTAPASQHPRRDNLPQQLTKLIGRDGALAEVERRLTSHRLVTLTGAGGVGKTRLAIEAGRSMLGRYQDGVWLAELAPLNDAQLVLSIIAEVLGVTLGGEAAPIESLLGVLKAKQLLLIIDNCEHVIGEAARVAEELIRNCPQLGILASSRERLAIPGESVIRVPSLAVPEPSDVLDAESARQFAAVRLFSERANALGEPFALTDDNAASVGSICRRLDGIPLAIELAVPRLKVLPLRELAHRLDERFRLLTGGSRTALPRQQTLQATIDWSYGLLGEPERTLLTRLSVFLGGTTISSITAVVTDRDLPADAVSDLLLSLVEKSLVHAEVDASEARYRLLESTRHYAFGKLGDAPALSRRHAEHFVVRLRQATAEWETTPTEDWLRRYEADLDNLRRALEWAFGPEGDPAVALDLVGNSHLLWAELGLILEHRRWVDAALVKTSSATPPRVMAALLSWQAGDVRELEDPADFEEAMRAAALYRRLRMPFQEGRALLRAGTARLLPDSVKAAEQLLNRAYGLVVGSGPTKTLARCLSALASARLFGEDLQRAQQLHEQAIGTYRQLGEVVTTQERPRRSGGSSRSIRSGGI